MLAYLDNTCGKEADEELKDEWYCYMLEPSISVEIKAEIQWVEGVKLTTLLSSAHP
jgi:hypothetical protein